MSGQHKGLEQEPGLFPRLSGALFPEARCYHLLMISVTLGNHE